MYLNCFVIISIHTPWASQHLQWNWIFFQVFFFFFTGLKIACYVLFLRQISSKFNFKSIFVQEGTSMSQTWTTDAYTPNVYEFYMAYL